SRAGPLIGQRAKLHSLKISPSRRLPQALCKLDEGLGDVLFGECTGFNPSLENFSPTRAVGRERVDDRIRQRIHLELRPSVFVRETPKPKARVLSVDVPIGEF